MNGTSNDSHHPFRVLRQPSQRELIHHIRSADVLHLAGPALLPLLFARLLGTPAVVEHHGYQSICPNGLLLYAPDRTICPGHFIAGRYGKCLQCNGRDMGWIASLRNLLSTFPRRWLCTRTAGNIAVSNHVATRIALPRTRTIYHGIENATVAHRIRRRLAQFPCALATRAVWFRRRAFQRFLMPRNILRALQFPFISLSSGTERNAPNSKRLCGVSAFKIASHLQANCAARISKKLCRRCRF